MQSFVESPQHSPAGSSLAAAYFKYTRPKFDCEQGIMSVAARPETTPPHWQRSVYYYYWAYLRRSTPYRVTCQNEGSGTCAQLYRSFGNIFTCDFKTWWLIHWHLFAEPSAVVLVPPAAQAPETEGYVTLHVNRFAEADQIQQAIKMAHLDYTKGQRSASQASFPIHQRPVLNTLFQHLYIYDFKLMNPAMHDEDIADIAGIMVSDRQEGLSLTHMERLGYSTVSLKSQMRRAKRKAVQHHLRMATRLIANAERGKFPCSDICQA